MSKRSNIIASITAAFLLPSVTHAQSSVLQEKYVYAAIGTPRASILAELPLVHRVFRKRCQGASCDKVLIGYLAERTEKLNQLTRAQFEIHKHPYFTRAQSAAGQANKGVVADVTSTSLALANGAKELNPLLGAAPTPGSLLAVGLLRFKVNEMMVENKSTSDRQKGRNLCFIAGVSTGAAANNIAVLMTGAVMAPVLIGVVAAKVQRDRCQRESSESHQMATILENNALRNYVAWMKSHAQANTLSQPQTPPPADQVEAAMLASL